MNLNSRKKSKMRKLLPTRRNKTGPVDTMVQEITDENGMLEDITIESARNGESVG